MEDERVQIITIPVRSDIDPSTLLDISIALKDIIVNEVESYGEECSVDEDEISVGDK